MQDQSPFNSKFLIAMVLFAAFYFGWNTYLQKKYPDLNKKANNGILTDKKTIEESGNPAKLSDALSNTGGNTTGSDIIGTVDKPVNAVENLISYEDENNSFEISSLGMGVRKFKIKNYTDKNKNNIILGQSDNYGLFELKLNDHSVNFNLVKLEEGKYRGTYSDNNLNVVREVYFNKKLNSFESQVKITGISESNLKSIKFFLPEKISVSKSSSFLFPSYDHQDFYIHHGGETTTLNFSNAKQDISNEYKTATLISLGSQYFATAALDQSEIIPDVKLGVSVNKNAAMAELSYPISPGKSDFIVKQIFYAGPKSINILSAVSEDLSSIINFGWLSFIAKPLLYSMKWFYGVVGNWGLAIILLTLMVRLFVLPFNLMQMKSMKAMQKMQPEMKAVREKYKDDPIRMNQEVMALMKQHNANPFGGCLPMILQIPIFFALYRVIGSSIELYQSPFVFWITDLSSHDKYYVLPVLMGISMFLQQKLTPTNMDPAQAKILQYMPLIFVVFMLNLPSGLTLYMFVSGVFGILQQTYILKSKASE